VPIAVTGPDDRNVVTAVSRYPSTTSAPGTALCRTCGSCPSTRSSSTAPSSSPWSTTSAPPPLWLRC